MKITGIMVYYYFVCERKLWYFLNQIGMEQNSELVSIGKILDDTAYDREDKGILIDDTINVDFIGNKAVLHEIKKTKAIEQKGVKDISAEIDFPLLRETKSVVLEDGDRDVLENVIKNIEEIAEMDKPIEPKNSKICKKCAYFDLCYV